MEENNNYEEYYKQAPKKKPEKPRRRFLYFWGPLLLKFLIVYIISMIFVSVLMGNYFIETIGTDVQAIGEYMSVEENYYQTLNEIMEDAVDYTTIMEGIAALVTIPFMIILFRKDRLREKNAGIVPAKKTALWKYIAIVPMAAALCIGVNNIFFISNLASTSTAYEETMTVLYSPSLGIQILCLAILVPICEEMVFRGLMYKRLRECSTFSWAMIYSAIVFSVVHMNLVQTIYAFVMGIVFAFVYEKYGSVKAPIIAHVTANLVAVLATNFDMFEWVLADQMRSGLLTVACAAIASSMYVFIQRMDDEEI